MRFLLYVDDSKHWHSAARGIGESVRRGGGHVTIVTTLWSEAKRKEALAEAARIVDLPPDRVAIVSRTGLVENVLPEEARHGDYDIVVLGRLGSLDWLTNGLIAHLLVRRTPASTLIMRGRTDGIRRFLVCTQGPRHGSVVLEAAAHLARAFGAELTVLHVVSQFPLTHEGEEALEAVTSHFLDQDLPEARHLADLERRLRELELPGRVKVRVGLVVEEILAEVHEGRHDLLVIGAHDPRGKGFLYQDIAGLLVRASPVSYLVVKDPARGLE